MDENFKEPLSKQISIDEHNDLELNHKLVLETLAS